MAAEEEEEEEEEEAAEKEKEQDPNAMEEDHVEEEDLSVKTMGESAAIGKNDAKGREKRVPAFMEEMDIEDEE